MKTEYQDKQDMFDFELMICWEKLELWKHEAWNLFYSAQVLYEFETVKSADVFETDKRLSALFSFDTSSRCYFNYRTQRMLWAFGFENILKGIILSNIKRLDISVNTVPLDKIKSHDLLKLAKQAGFSLTENESFYLGILEKCSVWAGRYPLPISASKMYESRKPMRSSEELNLRSIQRWKDFHEGKIPRVCCESDVIHSAVGHEEFSTYIRLKDNMIKRFDELNGSE